MSDQEKNPYALYPDEQMDRRPRYYDGQFLGSADFIDAQRYDIDRRRRHIRATVRPGVVSGLEVTGGADKVDIAAGTAVDDFGRQIVLTAAEEKGVRESDRGKNLVLFIRYGETTSDQSHSDQGTAGYTRFHEMPAVDYVEEGQDIPEHAVVIAALQVDGEGAVTADGTVRPRAGVLIPGATPLTLTADDADPGRATLAAALQVHAPDGTRMNANFPALRVKGYATVTASMRVGQNNSIGYGGVDNGADGLVVKGPLAAGGNSAVRGLGVGSAPHADEGVALARRIAVGKTAFTGDRALDVQGNVGLGGNVATTGWTRIDGTLEVKQAATLRSALDVSGAGTVGIDLGVGRDATVGRNAAVGGDLSVTGAGSIDKTLTVGQSATIHGATTVRNRFTATGRADIGGLITVGGAATIGGDTAITGSVSATTSASVGTTLTVGQGATIGGGASVGAGLTVGGDITMRGDTLDVGAGASGRHENAGKIKYAVHTTALEIFGAGVEVASRKVKLYAEGGVEATGALTTAGAITAGGGGSFAGNLSATGAATVNGNAVFKKGMVIGQTGTTGYGAVEQDGNDLVVNGQFAAGGSGGAAMYSLALGYDAQSGKEGYLFVKNRLGIGRTDPDRPLAVAGNALVDGALRVTGRVTVQHGTDNGIRFPNNIGGGSSDWAGLRYWVTDGEDTRLELGTGNDPNDIIVLRQDDTDMVVVRNQRVGIGGETGDTRLRVHGTIQFDNSGYHIQSPHARAMVIYGYFNSSQRLVYGKGIEGIERIEEGRYKVKFSPDFSGTPVVVATQVNDGNIRDNAVVYDIGNGKVMVKTGNDGGSRRDRAFCVIAIGPR